MALRGAGLEHAQLRLERVTWRRKASKASSTLRGRTPRRARKVLEPRKRRQRRPALAPWVSAVDICLGLHSPGTTGVAKSMTASSAGKPSLP